MGASRAISAPTCDDCGKEYAAPAYYTFPIEYAGDHECTGNLCPECAGPFLEPDNSEDRRRPVVDFYAGR